MAPAVLLWPLPLLMGWGLIGQPSGLLTSPTSEGARHLWTWWAAAGAGGLTQAHSSLLNHPQGLAIHVADPLHAFIFAVGSALGGPSVGYGLVLWLGLSVAGLAALLLARQAGAAPAGRVLAVAAGLSGAGLLGVAVDGITEGLGVGLVGLQLALLLRLREDEGWVPIFALGACIAAAAWTGPYNAVWVALLDVPVGLVLLRRRPKLLLGGLLGLLLSLPPLRAAWAHGQGRPGSAGSRALAEAPDPLAQPWRGAWREGADLLDLVVPGPLTGAVAVPTTAYLGLVLLLLAGIGAWKMQRGGRRPTGWILGALAFSALALGPLLVVAGEATAWPTPAALLERLPVLGRVTRWYRAGAVAVLLLAPLAAWAPKGRSAAWLLAALVMVDGRLMGPLPARFPVTLLHENGLLVGLSGPIAELPPQHPLGRPGHPADLNLLLQLSHGQPTTGTLDSLPGAATGPGLRALQRALHLPLGPEGQEQAASGAALLAMDGYRWLALYPELNGPGVGNLDAALGAPERQGDGMRVYGLTARP